MRCFARRRADRERNRGLEKGSACGIMTSRGAHGLRAGSHGSSGAPEWSSPPVPFLPSFLSPFPDLSSSPSGFFPSVSLLPAFLCFSSHLLAFLPDPLPQPFPSFPRSSLAFLSSFPFSSPISSSVSRLPPTHTLHVSRLGYSLQGLCGKHLCPAQGCEGWGRSTVQERLTVSSFHKQKSDFCCWLWLSSLDKAYVGVSSVPPKKTPSPVASLGWLIWDMEPTIPDDKIYLCLPVSVWYVLSGLARR